jgi:hypothetical protein
LFEGRGLTFLTQLLELAKSEIAADGYMSEAMRKMISRMFGSLDMPFANLCRGASAPEPKTEDQPSKRNSPKSDETKTERAFILCVIETKLKELSLRKEYTSERENLALDSEGRSFSLPPAEVSDKLLRYEAHIDQQLYRAMDELERLQRQRKGENVPPPLNVNLSRRT